jgi:hypothetical protein
MRKKLPRAIALAAGVFAALTCPVTELHFTPGTPRRLELGADIGSSAREIRSRAPSVSQKNPITLRRQV